MSHSDSDSLHVEKVIEEKVGDALGSQVKRLQRRSERSGQRRKAKSA